MTDLDNEMKGGQITFRDRIRSLNPNVRAAGMGFGYGFIFGSTIGIIGNLGELADEEARVARRFVQVARGGIQWGTMCGIIVIKSHYFSYDTGRKVRWRKVEKKKQSCLNSHRNPKLEESYSVQHISSKLHSLVKTKHNHLFCVFSPTSIF